MSEANVLLWLPFVFPVFFGGLWLAVTSLIGLLSGWFRLQRRYTATGFEQPLLRLRGQTGIMGAGASLRGVLTLEAYPSALGIAIWRPFGLFQKPLRIPWAEIEVEETRSFLMSMIKLRLGRPEQGTLRISAKSWARLIDAVPVHLRRGAPFW